MTQPHECRRPDFCRCHLSADEPNENCPLHGCGEWPPRCAVCGRLMKWPTLEELAGHEAQKQ